MYYEQNKELLLRKTTCLCGGEYAYKGIARHNKTLKHQAYLKSLEDNKTDNANNDNA